MVGVKVVRSRKFVEENEDSGKITTLYTGKKAVGIGWFIIILGVLLFVSSIYEIFLRPLGTN